MKIKSLTAIFMAAVLCFFAVACSTVQVIDPSKTTTATIDKDPNDSSSDNNDNQTSAKANEVKYKFLKVGKSPCTIIRTENKTIVIDAASEDKGADIITYLKEKKVKTVDYLIITNFSKSCIGGVPALLKDEGITVKAIYEPTYPKESNAYTSYINAVAAAAIKPTDITDGLSITADDLTVKFHAPKKSYGTMADENDEGNSVALTITHGKVNFLYTSRIAGERVDEVISQIGDTKYDLITVPNYGIFDAKYPALFTASGATKAVIFASTKNPPAIATTSALETAKFTYFVTRDGGVEAESASDVLSIKQ